jgi:predicted nucleotidyltransferase
MVLSKDLQEVEHAIQGIIEKLRAGYAPQKVILFGSYASGNARPDSDLDLLIIKDTAERFIDRGVTVRRVLADPQRILPLEILVLTPQEVTERLAVGDQFMTEILEKGRVLYAA